MDGVRRVRAESQAAFCQVFSNPKRVLILWTLADQEKSVGEIAESVEASLQNTSQHLRLMKSMGILDSRREGQTIYYYVIEDAPPTPCQLLVEVRKDSLRE